MPSVIVRKWLPASWPTIDAKRVRRCRNGDPLPDRNKLPARSDVPGTAEDPVRAIFAEQLQQAWAPDAALAPHTTEVLTALQAALQQALSGTPVPDAARNAQSAIDEALATS